MGVGVSGKGLVKVLHTIYAVDKMQGGLILDVVVGEGSSVLEQHIIEDNSLLISWDEILKFE